MNVSVIIPVYNAERFLSRAIESALWQYYVEEVVVVEDGSPDNALSICKHYDQNYEKVKLVQHSNRENRGAGATRNLGIDHASCEWIAFLDADDYYLEDRFVQTEKVLAQHPESDGVYEAVRNHFETEKLRAKFMATRPERFQGNSFQAVSFHVFDDVPPDQLFETLIKGASGFIHLDGLTVRKSLAKKVGGFHTKLHVMQDTHFHFKLALMGCLYNGGCHHAVAERVVHEENRITKLSEEEVLRMRMRMFQELLAWLLNNVQGCTQNANHIVWRLEDCEKKVGLSKLHSITNKLIRKLKLKTLERTRA